MSGSRPTVRARLLLALIALATATLIVGATSWMTLRQATGRLDRLHDDTLAAVDQALGLSRQATDLATRGPYLLTIESPFRLGQEADAARALVAGIMASLGPQDAVIADTLRGMDDSIRDLVMAALARVALTDQILRRNARITALERRFSNLAGTLRATLPEGRDWLTLQRIARALQGAGRTDNLVTVGEFQREFHGLVRGMEARSDAAGRGDLALLRTLAEGRNGLFELRRLELSRQIAAEGALARIRRGAEAVSLHAAEVTARAQSEIAAERARTVSAIAFAKGVIVFVGLISAAVALATALFVSGYVTGNLRSISDAMMRLAVGDRSTRLPRGEHAGDEIGKLFHAFRAFRANILRLDRSNRQLAQRNALFQNLYDGMSDGLAILSDSGSLIARNSRLAAVLRLDPEGLKGRPAMADLLAGAGWARVAGPHGFAELLHPDGRVVELRESRLATGGSVMLLSDASERRALEDRLRQAQRTEALGKIAGEVAHDFGNILSTISTCLHLMETAPPDRIVALRQSLGAALDLGGALTQRLLAFARRLHLEPEVMDLNGLVEGVEDLIALALEDRITLRITPCSTPLLVRIDPGQMESALLNLCLNAAQAIEGAGTIRISLDLASEDRALIAVIDTGCGMSPEVLAHAMEPFYTARADGTGTGLGLAMVYGFIRQSGGDVQITSTPGQGTTVQLMLPLCRADGPLLPALGRVLLVEDDPADADHARHVLGGADLHAVCSAAEAEALIAAAPAFDLVLTDLHLGLDPAGWRIAEAALRRDPRSRAIVLSGRLPAAHPLITRFPGRAFCLPKPLDPAALAACLQGPTFL
ncbi:ATP-binding protein [Gemmobacter fulvus]|uniref:ATP-binding protein n=1 Tax=Gemmobacter fulvus TaxID=2840474 RepID=UPI002796A765|nr:ATP-binding protein [Gemmobacter fulvus]MDQ1846720.1 ATP-binding protein [Gemmobacter fulvus]